jgi:hypothetical protein
MAVRVNLDYVLDAFQIYPLVRGVQLGADRPVAGGIGLGCLQEMVFEAFLNIFLVLFGVSGEPYLKGTFLDDRSNRWFSSPVRTNPLQEVIVLCTQQGGSS